MSLLASQQPRRPGAWRPPRAPAGAEPVPYRATDAAAWEGPGLALLVSLGLAALARPDVPRRQRLEGLETLQTDGREAQREAAAAMVAGALALAAWYALALGDLTARATAGTLALLGTARLLPSDRLSLATSVGRHAGFLRRFRRQLGTGSAPLDGRAVARAGLYADATWSTAMGVETDALQRRGYTEAMRVLGAADHCPGCLSEAGLWMPIWQVTPIGFFECGSRCHCRISYRGPAGTLF